MCWQIGKTTGGAGWAGFSFGKAATIGRVPSRPAGRRATCKYVGQPGTSCWWRQMSWLPANSDAPILSLCSSLLASYLEDVQCCV